VISERNFIHSSSKDKRCKAQTHIKPSSGTRSVLGLGVEIVACRWTLLRVMDDVLSGEEHDQEAEIGRVPALLTENRSEEWQETQSGHVQESASGAET
jgi:hypothetical protein